MKKYFKEKKEKESLLSEYLKDDVEYYFCSIEAKIRRTEYLIGILGDVALEEEIYELFLRKFQSFGGRYSVALRADTIKDIYEIVKKYSYLTADAIDEIWFRYIQDLFLEYDLIQVFEKYIQMYGKEGKTFELFLEYVEKCADEHQQIFETDSLQLDELKEGYSESFIGHLKSLIIRQHYTYEELKKMLPSADLIRKDELQLDEISARSRIDFGCCEPLSYTMFDTLLSEKNLDRFVETPAYYIGGDRIVTATFTKQEFLESVQTYKLVKKEG